MKVKKILPTIFAVVLLASSAQASIFATELVAHSGYLNGTSAYNDPTNLLGKPTGYVSLWPSGSSNVSLVEAASGAGVATQFQVGHWAVVKFDHQVVDDPDNPHGLDFIVYGASHFNSEEWISNTTDHRLYEISGNIYSNGSVLVSVSQDGENWYSYNDGPYGDGYLPTNPWVWSPDQYDATGSGWTEEENNYATPVDPGLTAADFAGTSYEAMQLYDGSAGGTGFDLAESGFDWIQYIKVEGTYAQSKGLIDAFADVAAGDNTDPVPIPGALWLLGSGLLGLVGIKKRI